MNELYKQYYSKLLAFINSKVQNKHDAQDILSEVFIKIYKNIDKLDSDEKITSWIYTITRNTIIDFYRKNNKTPSLLEFKEESIFDDKQQKKVFILNFPIALNLLLTHCLITIKKFCYYLK